MNNPAVSRVRSVKRVFVALVCLLWADALALRAGTHYVSLNGTNDIDNGYVTWDGAATEIQWAVSVATNGETVLVSNGIYTLTNQINILSNDVTVRSFTEEGHGTNDTIVNGNYPAYTNRCFYMTNGILNGFTISNGYAGVASGGNGGGILITNSGSVYNCFIYRNYCSNDANANYSGGGIYLYASAGIVSNCTVLSNIVYEGVYSSRSKGGGIYSRGSIVDSYISGNKAYEGGGIYHDAGLVTNCTVANNLATNCGGIYLSYAHVRNCVISNNVASGNGTGLGDYGGIYAGTGCTIYDSIIISNRAFHYYGGLTVCKGGIASNCLITGNRAGSYAGGAKVDGYYGPTVLANCEIRGNSIGGGQGGGVMHSDGIVRNCLIVSNTGEGVYSYVGNPARTYTSVVENCTIAGNLLGGLWLNQVTNTIQNCIIYTNASYDMKFGATAGSNNCWNNCTTNVFEPNHGNITNNPSFVDQGNNDYHLNANSPCINAGLNQNWMTNSYDLDGLRRIRYSTVDMGPYELIHSGTIYGF